MAFQVTPETDVAEAAMFHGAYVSLASNYGLGTGVSIIPFDTKEWDTDNFCSTGNNQFVIPEGVEFVQLGCNVVGFGTAGDGVQCFIRAQNGSRGIVRMAQTVSSHASDVQPSCNLVTGPIAVDTGESFRVYAKYYGTGVTLQGNNANYPNFFWIRVIKTPLGRPDSPTLP